MTNLEKKELREYCKKGYDFKTIRGLVECHSQTIKRYMKVFYAEKKV